MTPSELVGKSYNFDDGDSIKVIQVIDREIYNETTPVVTYLSQSGPGIPRKLQMPYHDFMEAFGHLFKE